MNAEATRQDDPHWGELVTLLGWPWKLALALVAAGAALLLLPHTGLVSPVNAAWNDGAALACLGSAALLALGSGLHTLRILLRGAAEEPQAERVPAEDLIGGLRRLLEEQQFQVHEATGAASRAVASAAQLSGLASHVEKQFRQTLEHAAPAAAPSAALPERLEAVLERLQDVVPEMARIETCARRMEAAGESLLTLPALLERVEENSQQIRQNVESLSAPPGVERIGPAVDRLERTVQVLEQLPERAQSLCAAAQTMVEQGNVTQLQATRVARAGQRMESLFGEAMQRFGETPAQGGEVPAGRLEELVRSLGGHVERVLRNEASLGDAARYLTETTDRFANGLTTLETHAVRLQALVSIAGQREAESSPLRDELAGLRQQVEAMAALAPRLDAIQGQLVQTLPPGLSATLERLGAVEADAAQLLQEAAAMSPPAFASRTAKLLQSVQENLRHLQATAAGPSQAA